MTKDEFLAKWWPLALAESAKRARADLDAVIAQAKREERERVATFIDDMAYNADESNRWINLYHDAPGSLADAIRALAATP